MRDSLAPYLGTLLLLGGCVSPPPSTATPALRSQVSSDEAREWAEDAFKAFGESLKGELLQAMQQGGPVAAVTICHQRAPEIAQEVSGQRGFSLGRSSHRVRNKSNAPGEPLRSYLDRYAGKPAKEAPILVEDGGSEWRVIAPISTQPLCLTCHGSAKNFPADLKAALERHYPQDQATEFKEGDLRGVFWATVPKERPSK